MSRHHVGRLIAASLSSTLVALTLLSAPALASNTRLIYIGEPGGTISFDSSGNELNGTISNFTRTRPGGLTAVNVEVRNDGSQTVNHANLLGGYAADTAVVNPLFPPPTGASLPATLSYAAAYPTAKCTIGPDGSGTAGRSLSCDLGTLPAYSTQTFTIIFQTPTGADASFSYWFGVYLAESNATGTNQDNFYATGSLATTTPTCDTDPAKNKDANFFLPATVVGLTASSCSGSTPGQVGSIASKGALSSTGTGTYAEVSISNTTLVCPAGYTCFGSAVQAQVLNGGPVPGGLQWTVTWYGTKSLSGVVHFWDTYIAGDPVHGADYTIIPFSKKYQCSASLKSNCWVTTSASKGNATPLWFQAIFITPDNGKSGGFI